LPDLASPRSRRGGEAADPRRNAPPEVNDPIIVVYGVDVLVSQGVMADAIRQIGVSEVTYY
jgi:hypothetical protein